MRDTKQLLNLWKEKVAEKELSEELLAMEKDANKASDAFYRDLEFGTGGLRGVIGAGTNRMNVYTVGKATQGLANYVLKHFSQGNRSVAISYDSRIHSDLFAQRAAGIFAANGIKVYLYKTLMPTPCLSYAVRRLGTSAGVMVTASHNPAKYNGYKVYGADGCQITEAAATEILAAIESTDIFDGVKYIPFETGLKSGAIEYIADDVLTEFIERVKKESVLGGERADRSASIVYSPLNGTGLVPVTRILKETGFENVTVVKEQEFPDGNFPTCPYPNPEIKEALALGLEYARRANADILIATDPDCDRVGIAVKDKKGEFVLLTGNEVGFLLLDFIASMRIKHGAMPKDPVFVKTIVTSDLAEKIATSYGIRTINVLTGFKYIGEQIGLLEKKGVPESYLLGFEESYGYLTGSYVRDKDAVVAAMLIAGMYAQSRERGQSLLDRLNSIYERFGYGFEESVSVTLEGKEGIEKIGGAMVSLREDLTNCKNKAEAQALLGGAPVEAVRDYQASKRYVFTDDGRKEEEIKLPKSNVLQFFNEDGDVVTVRPSGTEPKIKFYFGATGSDAPGKIETLKAQFVN